MPAKRLPWLKLWPVAIDHEKVAPLTDGQFRALVHVWCRGADQPIRGKFKNLRHAATVSGRSLSEVRALVAAGLLDERDDALWVHDWHQWQDKYESDLNRPRQPLHLDLSPDRELPLEDVDEPHYRTAEDSANTPPNTPRTLPPPLIYRSKKEEEEISEVEKAQRVHKGATLKEKREEARSQSANSSQNPDHLPTPSTTLRVGAPATQETPPSLSGSGDGLESLRDDERSLYAEGRFSFSSFEGFAPEPPSHESTSPSVDEQQSPLDRLQADLAEGYAVLVEHLGTRLKKTDSRYVNLKRALQAGHSLDTILREYDRCIVAQEAKGGSVEMAMYHAFHALERREEATPAVQAPAAPKTPPLVTTPRIEQPHQQKVAVFEKAIERYTQKGVDIPQSVFDGLAQARAQLAAAVN